MRGEHPIAEQVRSSNLHEGNVLNSVNFEMTVKSEKKKKANVRQVEPNRGARTGAPLVEIISRAGSSMPDPTPPPPAVSTVLRRMAKNRPTKADLVVQQMAAAVAPGYSQTPSPGLDKNSTGSSYVTGGFQPSPPEEAIWVEEGDATYTAFFLRHSIARAFDRIRKSASVLWSGDKATYPNGHEQLSSQAALEEEIDSNLQPEMDIHGVVNEQLGGRLTVDDGSEINCLPNSMRGPNGEVIRMNAHQTNSFSLPCAGWNGTVTLTINFMPGVSGVGGNFMVYGIKGGVRTLVATSTAFGPTVAGTAGNPTVAADLSAYERFQVVLVKTSGPSLWLQDNVSVSFTTTLNYWDPYFNSMSKLGYVDRFCPTGKIGVLSPVGPLTGDGAPQGQVRVIRVKGRETVESILASTSLGTLWTGAFLNSVTQNEKVTQFELKGGAAPIPMSQANARWHRRTAVNSDAGVLMIAKVYATSIVAPQMAIVTDFGYNYTVVPGTPNFQMTQRVLDTAAFDAAVELDNVSIRATCNPDHLDMLKRLLVGAGVAQKTANTAVDSVEFAEEVLKSVAQLGMYLLPIALAVI